MAESHTLCPLGQSPQAGVGVHCPVLVNRSNQRVSFPGHLPRHAYHGPFWEMLSKHLILPSCQPAGDLECATGPQLITFRYS